MDYERIRELLEEIVENLNEIISIMGEEEETPAYTTNWACERCGTILNSQTVDRHHCEEL